MSELQKAYENLRFLNSPDARAIRVLAELLEPQSRFRKFGIRDTIVFFGSARTRPPGEIKRDFDAAMRRAARKGSRKATAERRLSQFEEEMRLSRYYEDAAELSRRLTAWARKLGGGLKRFVICSGGGPGIMEAANRGAQSAGGLSIGLNVSLPMEQEPNRYLSQRYSFEFHYFFMRKFWFVYPARALIVFPGGFGTMDELFETLTLMQTRKTPRIPVVVYGREYWDEVIDFDAMVRRGTISKKDMNLIRFASSVEDAFQYLKVELSKRSAFWPLLGRGV